MTSYGYEITDEVLRMESLIKRTLEGGGALRRLRADLRASVYDTVDMFKQSSPEGIHCPPVLVDLVLELLESYKFTFTRSVFDKEAPPTSRPSREELHRKLGIVEMEGVTAFEQLCMRPTQNVDEQCQTTIRGKEASPLSRERPLRDVHEKHITASTSGSLTADSGSHQREPREHGPSNQGRSRNQVPHGGSRNQPKGQGRGKNVESVTHKDAASGKSIEESSRDEDRPQETSLSAYNFGAQRDGSAPAGRHASTANRNSSYVLTDGRNFDDDCDDGNVLYIERQTNGDRPNLRYVPDRDTSASKDRNMRYPGDADGDSNPPMMETPLTVARPLAKSFRESRLASEQRRQQSSAGQQKPQQRSATGAYKEYCPPHGNSPLPAHSKINATQMDDCLNCSYDSTASPVGELSRSRSMSDFVD